MMRVIIVLATVALCLSTAASSPLADKQESRAKKNVFKELDGPIEIDGGSYLTGENKGELLAYGPIETRRRSYHNSEVRDVENLIKPSWNLERETPDRRSSLVPDVAASLADETTSPNADRFGSIAFNSREVRFMGPHQKEVEMKDDVASKMVVVIDNLQKEAGEVWGQVNDKLDKGLQDIKRSEVWGQVNEKLDKGWTDLRTMVEGLVSKRQQP